MVGSARVRSALDWRTQGSAGGQAPDGRRCGALGAVGCGGEAQRVHLQPPHQRLLPPAAAAPVRPAPAHHAGARRGRFVAGEPQLRTTSFAGASDPILSQTMPRLIASDAFLAEVYNPANYFLDTFEREFTTNEDLLLIPPR